MFQNDLDDPERGILVVCCATHKTKVFIDYFDGICIYIFVIFI